MGLRIFTNVEALNAHNNLVLTNSKVAQSLKRLSSGFRIESAKDDAAGFAIANSFKAKISSMRVASQNATEAQSMLQTADGAYSKIHDILIRMKNLSTQASSGQTENLGTLNNEFKALQDEIDAIANSTKYGGTTLVTGSAVNITFQVGASNTADDRIAVDFLGATTGCLAVSSGSINVNTASGAQIAMSAIDTALSSVNYSMGELGSYRNRMQYTIENLAVSMENFSASESSIRDVDMAYEVMQFTKNQILQQSGMAMMSQANSAPQQILSLLK